MVSVIIPVYNHGKTIKTAIDSVLFQSYSPIEVVVVNDGSTDNTADALEVIRNDKKYNKLNIRIITTENRGAPSARNTGFEITTGEFVIFWDADTVADRQMLEKMVAALEMCPAASYAYSAFKFGFKTFKSQPFSADALKQSNYIDVTSLIRKNDFPKFDMAIKRFQDWDLWLTMLENKKTGVYIPEILYKKFVRSRKGISKWLPRFFYSLPFKTKAVKEYENARQIVLEKHCLTGTV